ncbi:1585_t:CDS:1, partial [Dentiscutata erythropus]
KASAKGNLQLYSYLQAGYQICSTHYIAIVENQLPVSISMPAQSGFLSTLLVNLSLGD